MTMTPDNKKRRDNEIVDGNLRPAGYEQLTSSSSAAALTVPAGARMALIRASTQDVRWRDDGDIAATTRRNTLDMAGLVLSTGTFAATSRRNTLALSGLVSDTATFGATTRRNTFAALGSASAFGTFAANTRRNSLAANGTVGLIIPSTRRQTIRLRRTAPRGFAN